MFSATNSIGTALVQPKASGSTRSVQSLVRTCQSFFSALPFSIRPLLLLCILSVGCFWAAPVYGEIYRFKAYTSSMGLPSNTIYALFQDRTGFLWIGTDSGLCRYDGVLFTIFAKSDGLPESNVRAMCEDPQGRLWVATEAGICSFENGRFTTYTTAQGLPNNHVYSAICARDGSLWFGTANGLAHLVNGKFTTYGQNQGVPPERIWALLEDHNRTLWIGTRGGGLVKYSNGAFTRFSRREGLPDERIFGLSEDPQGKIWITTSGGLSSFDGTKFRTYTTAAGMGSDSTDKSFTDKYGRVWCSTFGGGLNRIETDGHITIFNRSKGLLDNYLTSLLQDSEGNIWCGTRSSGICRFTNESFAAFTRETGLTSGTLTGLARTPDGTLWFSSLGGGMSSLAPTGAIKTYETKDGLLEMDLWSIAVDQKGRIWTGGYRGVSCFDGNKFTTYPLQTVGARDRITAIVDDGKGNLLFGSHPSTSNGLICYDGTTFKLLTTEHGLLQNPVTGFAHDRNGNILICTEGGMNTWDGQHIGLHPVSRLLPNTRIRCAYVDEQNVLWIGTLEGLYRYDGTGVQIFTSKEGLPSNTIRAITSLNSELWVGTTRGISVYNGQRFRTYTTKDGLGNDEIYSGAVLRQPDGTLWFGTNDGAVRYRTMPPIGVAGVPRVAINHLHVNDREVQPGGELSLKFKENTISVEYFGISFVDEEAVRYRWWMEGFETDWSDPTANRSVRFTNLPPGAYRFHLKAVSAAGAWSEPLTLHIRVARPFWQTWWFNLMVVAGVFGFGYYIYIGQIRHVERRQERRVALLRHIQEQRLESLQQLLRSIQAINSRLDLTTVLQRITEESASLVNGEPGAIGLIEDDHVVFRHIWMDGHWDDAVLRFKIGEGVAGKAATGQTVIMDHAQESAEVLYHDVLDKYHVAGMIDVPIISRTGKVVGVLDVRRKKTAPPFTDMDRHLLEALANQAAVAIENAALYGELGEKNTELEEKNLMIAESLRELKRLYEQEQEVTRSLQELDQMKTNFMIVSSHEMRTPLTVLKGYTDALLDEYLGPLTEGQQRSIATCKRMVDRLAASFSDILEMLKLSEGRIALRLTRFDLRNVVQNAMTDLETFVQQRRQAVTIEAEGEFPLLADEEKVQLVVLNVLQNAIKFTHDDGHIRICISREAETAHLVITDSGIGIESHEIGKVFEKFYTNSDPSRHKSGKFEFATRGTGLGLSIAKSYVEAHGGHIWAESKGAGAGSSFHIILPLAYRSGLTPDGSGHTETATDSGAHVAM
ncbi:MAG: GAF domain-containing protein [Blastocatellia bacterium]|nr:GAF domain-containing protein [Blastocatellia bacterium]